MLKKIIIESVIINKTLYCLQHQIKYTKYHLIGENKEKEQIYQFIKKLNYMKIMMQISCFLVIKNKLLYLI